MERKGYTAVRGASSLDSFFGYGVLRGSQASSWPYSSLYTYQYIGSLYDELKDLGLITGQEEIPAGVFNVRSPSLYEECFGSVSSFLKKSETESGDQSFVFEKLYHSYVANPEKIIENKKVMDIVFNSGIEETWGGEPVIIIGKIHGQGRFSNKWNVSNGFPFFSFRSKGYCDNSSRDMTMALGFIRKEKRCFLCPSPPRFIVDQFSSFEEEETALKIN